MRPRLSSRAVSFSRMAAAILILGAFPVFAQNPLASAKAKAHMAAAASNAHTAAEQNVETQQRTAAPATAASRRTLAATQRPGSRLDIATTDTVGQSPVIMREVYAYPLDGRRDPFVSLLTTNELRPAMSDLRLTGILIDQSGSHSVATLRDLTTNAQYRVTMGSTLGRMRVSAIRVKSVVFTIDEFGTTRQDSLVLGDSTKVRR